MKCTQIACHHSSTIQHKEATMIYKWLTSAVVALTVSGPLLAQECKPSKWGANDEIGAANYITPQSVLAATK
ncbi:MAG: hypothetical protein EBQ48_14165, partial [Betaproteobacteria bacterium]|nr:hypothetical protein [Betaproteobacteria bacterium]